MPPWNTLLEHFTAEPDEAKSAWIGDQLPHWLSEVGRRRGDRNVIIYISAFLQKPWAPADSISITYEDLNGFMAMLHQMDCSKGLTLILHTPGGVVTAAETIVSYLRAKFEDIEVVVPAFAMSAGTMISLAANRIYMDRPSQLGPIDPQMPAGNGTSVSAQAVVDQFERAKADILAVTATAHVWAPVLASLGPALLQQAQNALSFSERMVAEWLSSGMLKGASDPESAGAAVAHHFSDATRHLDHARRIGRDEARQQGLDIRFLEEDQALQDAVLSLYHVATIAIEQTLASKIIMSSNGSTWQKQVVPPGAILQQAATPPSAEQPIPLPAPPPTQQSGSRQQRRAADRQRQKGR